MGDYHHIGWKINITTATTATTCSPSKLVLITQARLLVSEVASQGKAVKYEVEQKMFQSQFVANYQLSSSHW